MSLTDENLTYTKYLQASDLIEEQLRLDYSRTTTLAFALIEFLNFD
jgi:hypothetical protein